MPPEASILITRLVCFFVLVLELLLSILTIAGDMVILKDHISLPGLTGSNPLEGLNDDRFGPRFPPMSDAYAPALRELAKKVTRDFCFLATSRKLQLAIRRAGW